jgi:hypothetical protein
MSSPSHCRLDRRLKLQKNQIADFEVALRTALICLAFHPGLSMKQMLTDQLMHKLTVIQLASQIREYSSRRWNSTVLRRKTIEDLKRGMPQSRMAASIVPILSC